MTTPVYIPDQVDQALARFLSQYQSADLLNGLATALITPIQALEDCLQQLLFQRLDLTQTIGEQLDLYAELVGISRPPGTDDADLIQLIKVAIAENSSDATPETIIALFVLLTGATNVLFDDNYRAGVGISSEISLAEDDANNIFQVIKQALGAAVTLDYIIDYDPINSFSLVGVKAGMGLGSVYDATIGGTFPPAHYNTGHAFALAGADQGSRGLSSVYDRTIGGVFSS